MKTKLIHILLVVVFLLLTAVFYAKIPESKIYPPIFSKKFPLSTPISFWASTLGMRRLAADIIWVQTFQYYGSSGEELQFSKDKDYGKRFPELKSYWQQLIRFDPIFTQVHLIGPATLAWNLKRHAEAMELIDESIETVENMYENFKDLEITEELEKHPLILGKFSYLAELRWKLYILKTVLIYFHLDKFEKAIPLLEGLVFRKDTPDEIKIMLAQVYEKRKDYDKAMRLWDIIANTTKKENRKINAYKNINKLRELIASD